MSAGRGTDALQAGELPITLRRCARALDRVPDGGMLAGKVGDEEVLLARRGSEIFAIDARCSHYKGPLAEGLLVGEEIRCPRHHACFSVRTGEALRAPALDSLTCWRVERVADRFTAPGQFQAASIDVPQIGKPMMKGVVDQKMPGPGNPASLCPPHRDLRTNQTKACFDAGPV